MTAIIPADAPPSVQAAIRQLNDEIRVLSSKLSSLPSSVAPADLREVDRRVSRLETKPTYRTMDDVFGLNPPLGQCCQATHSIDQAIASAAWTAMALDTDIFNSFGLHNTAVNNGRVTFSLAGLYFFGGTVAWTTSALGNIRGVSIRLNGATFINVNSLTLATAWGNASGNVLTTIGLRKFASGDYIELMGYQDTGGNLNSLATSYSPLFWTYKVV